MSSCSKRHLAHLAMVPLFMAMLASCESYDPPPAATLIQPADGAFRQGDPIRVEFSEPIVESSLRVLIWPAERDIEGELLADRPLVECRGDQDQCGDLALDLAADRRSIELALAGDLGIPGRPMAIEIAPGLEDRDGNDTGSGYFFDFQFRPGDDTNSDPIKFDDGVYILLSQISQPIPAVLTFISEVRILEDGTFALAGGEGDEIGGAPKNTRDPESLIIDTTDQGYAMFVVGHVSLTPEGKRLLETDPIDVSLPVLSMTIELHNLRLFAEITKNPDTGLDRLEGTLSMDDIVLFMNGKETPLDGTSTALIADFVPSDVVPTGHPTICGDNKCGDVVGSCDPPTDFPPDGFCPD